MRAERITTVIWRTGFGPDTRWLGVPVLGPDGRTGPPAMNVAGRLAADGQRVQKFH